MGSQRVRHNELLTHTFTLTFDTIIVILHNKGSSFMREAME